MMMTMAQAALQLALEAHAGQTRDGRDGEWLRIRSDLVTLCRKTDLHEGTFGL